MFLLAMQREGFVLERSPTGVAAQRAGHRVVGTREVL